MSQANLLDAEEASKSQKNADRLLLPTMPITAGGIYPRALEHLVLPPDGGRKRGVVVFFVCSVA